MSGGSACGAPIRPIAIIGGTGPAGMGLARRWARAGETIIIGSRDAQRAQLAGAAIQQKVGHPANVSGMDNAAACAAADILMLTVPFDAQASLLKQLKPAITPGCSDDPDAAQLTRGLAAKIPGVRAIDGGKLENARIVEQITALLIGLNIRHKARAGVRITGLPPAAYR